MSCSTTVRQGCFSWRKAPALDVSARDHTSVFVGVCFVLSVKLCNICFSWFDVHCHAIPHDHPCWCLFAAHTVQQEVSFRSFVLAKAVHWKTIHRIADTVRFRGTSCFSRGGAVHVNSLHVLHHSCRLSCFALETLLETWSSSVNQLCHEIAKQEHFRIAWKRHGVSELGLRAMRAHRN